jgi:hypothetical protein
VVFVYQGTVEQGPMWFDRLFPGARAIADPDGDLYRAFGVARGGMREMFGAASWACGLRAVRQGHFVNRKIGDPWTLPTIVAVRDRSIVWEFRGEHAGDHPDVTTIPEQLEPA